MQLSYQKIHSFRHNRISELEAVAVRAIVREPVFCRRLWFSIGGFHGAFHFGGFQYLSPTQVWLNFRTKSSLKSVGTQHRTNRNVCGREVRWIERKEDTQSKFKWYPLFRRGYG